MDPYGMGPPEGRMARARYQEERPPIDDLSKLEHLNEETLLEELHLRYRKDLIYTYVGDVTVAINPYKTLRLYDDRYHESFSDLRVRSQLPPHIFWVADKAYQRMRDSSANQSIVISGESGAGKTESTKHLVKHITYLCRTHYESLNEKLLHVNPVLEAFGNAKTALNHNSSRFGKYIEMHFSPDGRLNGAQIYDYLLEKSRIVQRGKHERNFHIFYYFLAGLTQEQMDALYLQEAEAYRVMLDHHRRAFYNEQDMQLSRHALYKIEDIMKSIGLTGEEIWFLYTILASILHITEIKFAEADDNTDGVVIMSEQPLEDAANLLGVSVEALEEGLTRSTLPGEDIKTYLNMSKANDARDSLAKALYQRAFGWLVGRINGHLQMPVPSDNRDGHRTAANRKTIGILDLCGFEKFEHNGFEQLLINVANEKLQYYFNEHLFSQEIETIKSDGVDWTKIHYKNNLLIIDLFFGNPTKGRLGLLDIMNEETHKPQSTDEKMVRRFHETLHDNKHYQAPRHDGPIFSILHFAGKVEYDAENFLKKKKVPTATLR